MNRVLALIALAAALAPQRSPAQGGPTGGGLPTTNPAVLMLRIFWPPGSTASTPTPVPSVPLAPGTGGRSIGLTALQVGDIILSTTDAAVSYGIRAATGSLVSHAMLYVGDGLVVEAIRPGVVHRPLAEAIDDASLAVALRHPGITPTIAAQIRDFAGNQIGKSYEGVGLIQQAAFRIDLALCNSGAYADPVKCREWVGQADIGPGDDSKFICSELVLAAYEHAGVPLTAEPPSWGSPGELADLRLSATLAYVGHLKWTGP